MLRNLMTQWQAYLDDFNDMQATRPEERIKNRDIISFIMIFIAFFTGLGFIVTDDPDAMRTYIAIERMQNGCKVSQITLDGGPHKESAFFIRNTDLDAFDPPPGFDRATAIDIIKKSHKAFRLNPGDRVAVKFDPQTGYCDVAVLIDDKSGNNTVHIREYEVTTNGSVYGPKKSYTVNVDEVDPKLGTIWAMIPDNASGTEWASLP